MGGKAEADRRLQNEELEFVAKVGSESWCSLPKGSSSQGGHLDEGEVLVAGPSDQIHRDALVKAHQAAALRYG